MRVLSLRHRLAAVSLALVLAWTAGLIPTAGRALAVEDTVEDPGSEDPAVAADPAVIEAEARALAAQEEVRRLTGELDAAAAAFELAQAHHLRLVEELAGSDEVVAAVHTSTAEAEDAFRERIVEAYTSPPNAFALAGAVLSAPDAGTALHRAELLERATVHSAESLAGAQRVAALTLDSVRQHQVVSAGSAGAAAEREAAALALDQAVEGAREQLADARGQLEDARDQAKREIEQRRIAAEAAAAAAAAAASVNLSGSGPLPPVDGKVCPIGAPNGFIDSWGFPRSGGRRHKGVDMFAAYSTPLYAVANGTVTRVYVNRLGGLSIDLVDDAGDRYYYAHLSSAAVVSGQRVAAGQTIGANGDSGNARGTPPHLHWQYHPGGGEPINPYPLAAALCR